MKTLIKKEPVLSAATCLAALSMLLIKPDMKYIDYIDFRTLGILLSLMIVMEGLKEIGLFDKMAKSMIKKAGNMRQLILLLVMLCFFFSMLITNDVALITFVPLTITVLHMLKDSIGKKFLIPIVVMQTVAANLGSMLTPIGNPQNLYLYGISEKGLLEFVWLMLPYTLLSFFLLLIMSLMIGRDRKESLAVEFADEEGIREKKLLGVYLLLFVLCLLSVVRVLHFLVVLVIVMGTVLVLQRKVLKTVDYALILTFVAFFVFIGNMGRLEVFRDLLVGFVKGNEILTSILASQIVSNVPAALLLSGFTNQYDVLIIGTNIGGLGTLIASMASLISFKYISKEDANLRGKYMGYFTAVNLIFLLILMVIVYV